MIDQAGLKSRQLSQFIENEALPGTGIDKAAFWSGFSALHDLAPRNRELLAERDRLQQELDTWHRAHPGRARPRRVSRVPRTDRLPRAGPVERRGSHRERRQIAARPARSSSCRCRTRYALNAERPLGQPATRCTAPMRCLKTAAPNAPRLQPDARQRVIARVLDNAAPLASGSHRDALRCVQDGQLAVETAKASGLAQPAFVGSGGPTRRPRSC